MRRCVNVIGCSQMLVSPVAYVKQKSTRRNTTRLYLNSRVYESGEIQRRIRAVKTASPSLL